VKIKVCLGEGASAYFEGTNGLSRMHRTFTRKSFSPPPFARAL